MNSPKVVAETIDNESVVINLDKGTYYSIRATGAELWESLRAGVPSEVLLGEILAFSNDPNAPAGTQAFIDQLVQEELLVVDDGPSAALGGVRFEMAFENPTLDKYSDMEALLLLDPIHDVDEVGWPVPG
jgi:hypothetical protein